MPIYDTCRSCGAPISWAFTLKGKRLPMDPDPAENGNVILPIDEDGLPLPAIVFRDAEDAMDGFPGANRYLSHFVTCPNAGAHRRKPRPANFQEGA